MTELKAPDEIWLQINHAGMGEHTWCDHETEWEDEVKYTRAASQSGELISKEDFIKITDDLEKNFQNQLAVTGRAIEDYRQLKSKYEWQPIESAPKDGKKFLFFQEWVTSVGNYELAIYSRASHWQPLPPPPSTHNLRG